jgi:Ran GTPase-activating protein (RanGAP) involved in mRNA processing and transport
MCVRASFTHSLADGVGKCSRLTHLRLNYNNVSCDAAAGYARALRACPALVLLDLTGNSLHCAGASALARALERCTSLQDLRLPFNYIGFLGKLVSLPVLRKPTTQT